MFDIKLNKYDILYPFEVVGLCNETQLDMGDNLIKIA